MAINPNNYPHLLAEGFRKTSCEDPAYNCIAWATAADTENFWWPPGGNGSYWPAGIRKDVSVEAFVEMFEAQGFAECSDFSVEEGYEKVALCRCGGLPD